MDRHFYCRIYCVIDNNLFCCFQVLTQGGLTAHDRKFSSSTPLNIRCPMFIACQQAMDFGEEHNDAMDVHLRKFFFKTLKKPLLAGIQQILKSH